MEELKKLSLKDDFNNEWYVSYYIYCKEGTYTCYCGRNINNVYIFMNKHNFKTIILGALCSLIFRPQVVFYHTYINTDYNYIDKECCKNVLINKSFLGNKCERCTCIGYELTDDNNLENLIMEYYYIK